MAFINMGSIWRWWRAEINALLPLEDCRRAASRKSHAEIYAGPEQAMLWRRPKLYRPITPAAAAPTLDDVIRQLKPRDRVILTVDAAHCLFRQRTIPANALVHAGQILALDLARTTPFKAEDVFTGWCRDGKPTPEGSQPVLQAVLRRDLLQQALNSIAARKARPVAIAIRSGGQPALQIVLDVEGQPFGTATRRRWAKAAGWLLLIWIAAAAGLGFASSRQQAQGLQTLEAAIARVQQGALEKRKSFDRVAAVRKLAGALAARRRNEPPILAIWEELSRLLPDGAWLNSVSLNQGNIQIEGQAAAAEELIPLLEASMLFKNAQFASPVYKNPSEPLVRFAVKAGFEGPLP